MHVVSGERRNKIPATKFGLAASRIRNSTNGDVLVMTEVELQPDSMRYCENFIDQSIQGDYLFSYNLDQTTYHFIPSLNCPAWQTCEEQGTRDTTINFAAYIRDRYQFTEIDSKKNLSLSVLEGRKGYHKKRCMVDLCTTNYLLRFIYDDEVYLSFIPCSLKKNYADWAMAYKRHEVSIPSIVNLAAQKKR